MRPLPLVGRHDDRAPAPSIRERIRAIDAGEPVISAHFLRDEAALLLASGEVVLAGAAPTGA